MNKIKTKFFAPILFLLFALNFSVYSQAFRPSGFTEEKLQSKLMKREMPYRVILPKEAQAKNSEKFPVVYLLHGLTGHFNDWTNKTQLVKYASDYKYIIVMPEGNNGWYSDSINVPDDKYESYIINELIPEIEKKFPAANTRENRAIAGLSMGGYGSLKFGLKYPEKFVLAGSFSGALMAPQLTVKQAEMTRWQALVDSIKNVYGDDDSETRKQNDIFKIVGTKSESELKSLPFLYLDCGTEDGLVQVNRDFMKLLADKKVPHEYRELPGAHNWEYWDAQVQEFLRVSRKFVGAPKVKAKSN